MVTRPAGQGEKTLGSFGELGAYPAPKPYRTIRPETAGAAVTMLPQTAADCSQRMCMLLEKLLTKFAQWQRFGTTWIRTGGAGVGVAPAATSVIAAFTVPEGKRAMIQRIGVDAAPAAALLTIAWTLQISGAVHPYLNTLIIPGSSIANPIEFPVALEASQQVNLLATNLAPGAITVNATMLGFVANESEP